MTREERHKSKDTRWLSGLVKKMIELSEPAARRSDADDISLAAVRNQLARRPAASRQAA